MKQFLFFIIILILAVAQESPAQKKKAERAYSSFSAGEYFDAIDLFKNAYSKTRKSDKASRTELVFMIAECYRLINDPKNAETWYKLAVRSSYSKPEAQYLALQNHLRKTTNINWQSMNLKNINRLLHPMREPIRK